MPIPVCENFSGNGDSVCKDGLGHGGRLAAAIALAGGLDRGTAFIEKTRN